MSLRYRLWLSFAPLLLLLTALGAAYIESLRIVGNRIEAILRENYRSVEAMNGLVEAAERIDSSFQFALAGQPGAPKQFQDNWAAYRKHLDFERQNITEPGEADLVVKLADATDRYEQLGRRFFAPDRPPAHRKSDYFQPDGRPGPLLSTFQVVKDLSNEIRRINQESMEDASRNARETASRARLWAVLGLIAAVAATTAIAWRTTRTILRPIDDLTNSARAVGDGRFELMITADTKDEIGELVAAFNRMTSQLRDLRQSQAARLLRVQQASQAAIDSFPDPVVVVDGSGRVDMANPAARRLLGVNADGDHRYWQPPERIRPHVERALKSQQAFVSQSFEEAVAFRTGDEERTYIPQVLPVRDPYGGTLGAAIVLNDVTRFRLLDEFKSDLVATASHELKTPLSSLRLAVHILLEEVVGPLNPKQSELLVDARENTERLVRIVDHLLALAKLERGGEQLRLTPQDPVGLLRDAADRVQAVLADKRLNFDIDADHPPSPVVVDVERFGQVLDNLLVNAATYTDPGGVITLAARGTDDGRVEFAVKDSGVGIPAQYVNRVFDRFFRVPGRTRGSGTGLGLTIVKEIVSAHGGEIVCQSAEGEGTTFRITLPVEGSSAGDWVGGAP